MSATPDKYWPAPQSTWDSWSDLLVATQLGMSRAGFSGVDRHWKDTEPTRFELRCALGAKAGRPEQCYRPLLLAKPGELDGQWRVRELVAESTESQRHPKHTGVLGLSSWLTDPPTEIVDLHAGDEVVGHRALHIIEGAVRAAARREGRFIVGGGERGGGGKGVYTLCCVLGTQDCLFRVRFHYLDVDEGEEPCYRVQEIRAKHTCSSQAGPPSEALQSRIDFWPVVKLDEGSIGKPLTLSLFPFGAGIEPKVDQHIGPFPVTAKPPLTASNPRRPSHTPDPAPPPPAKPSSRLIDAEIACAAASEKLTTANADVERLQAAIDKAEDDAELQKEIDEARKVVEKRREKLEKWRRKVESVRRKEGKSRRRAS